MDKIAGDGEGGFRPRHRWTGGVDESRLGRYGIRQRWCGRKIEIGFEHARMDGDNFMPCEGRQHKSKPQRIALHRDTVGVPGKCDIRGLGGDRHGREISRQLCLRRGLVDRDGGLEGGRGQAARIALYLFDRDAGVQLLRSG